MSVSSDMAKLRELLGVETNAEVLPAVRALQQQSVAVAVSWTPGTPELEAVVSVLGNHPVPWPALSATLRAGLAVIDVQTAQHAQQLQALLQQEKARQNDTKEQ